MFVREQAPFARAPGEEQIARHHVVSRVLPRDDPARIFGDETNARVAEHAPVGVQASACFQRPDRLKPALQLARGDAQGGDGPRTAMEQQRQQPPGAPD